MAKIGAALLALAVAVAAAPSFADPPALRVGLPRSPDAAGAIAARDAGYFRRHEVGAVLKFFDDPAALAAGKEIDVGVAPFSPELLKAAAKGAILFVAGAAREAKGQPGLALLAANNSDLAKPKDVAGHTLALSGWPAEFALSLLAEKYALDAKALKVTALATPAEAASALKDGKAEAALLPASLAKPLADAGDAKLLGWAGSETPFPLGAVFVTAEANRRRDDVARFLAAYREGVRAYDDKVWNAAKQGSAAIDGHAKPLMDALERALKQKPEEFVPRLVYLDRDAMLDGAAFAKLVAWMQARKMIDGGDAAKMVDPGYGFVR